MNINEIDKLVRNFLESTKLPIDSIDFNEDGESGVYWFTIKTSNRDYFLRHEGEALNAINYLIRKLSEKILKEEDVKSTTIIVDVEGHYKKKIDNLKTTAHMMAERARFFKRDVEVPPMPPEDRKIIHTFLAQQKDIITESTGEGMNRRVVIKFKEKEDETI